MHSFHKNTRFPQIYFGELEVCYVEPVYCCLFGDNLVFMKAPHWHIISFAMTELQGSTH